MPIGFRAVANDTSAGTGTATASIGIPSPATLRPGDLLLAQILVDGGATTTSTAPPGWTLVRRVDVGTTISLAIYYRVATIEPPRWAWNFSVSGYHCGVVVAYTGVDPWSPIDAELGQALASSTSQTTPALVTSIGPTETVLSYAVAKPAAYGFASGTVGRVVTGNNNLGTGNTLGVADTVTPAAGAIPGYTGTSTVAGVAAVHAIALRPSPARMSSEDAFRAFVSLLPPGDELLYDLGNQSDDFDALFRSLADGWKRYGFDYLDKIRAEWNAAASVLKLPDWEAAFGITYGAASAANVWNATRQSAVLSKARESGATTAANVRAIVEPLLGYAGANVGTLSVLETPRAALTTAHTYAIPTGTIVAPGGLTVTFKVLDDGQVSAAGVQLALTLTHTAIDQLGVTLTGPPAANHPQVSVTWPAGSLGKGSVTAQTLYLYERATSAGGSIFGTWTMFISSSGGTGSTSASSLFVEGAGLDATGRNGLGGDIFTWGVQPDPTKVVNPDYVGVLRALARITPGYAVARLIYQSAAQYGGLYQLYAVPDDANALPDMCIPT